MHGRIYPGFAVFDIRINEITDIAGACRACVYDRGHALIHTDKVGRNSKMGLVVYMHMAVYEARGNIASGDIDHLGISLRLDMVLYGGYLSILDKDVLFVLVEAIGLAYEHSAL